MNHASARPYGWLGLLVGGLLFACQAPPTPPASAPTSMSSPVVSPSPSASTQLEVVIAPRVPRVVVGESLQLTAQSNGGPLRWRLAGWASEMATLTADGRLTPQRAGAIVVVGMVAGQEIPVLVAAIAPDYRDHAAPFAVLMPPARSSGTYYVDTADDWAAFWAESRVPGPAPTVNFEQEVVLVRYFPSWGFESNPHLHEAEPLVTGLDAGLSLVQPSGNRRFLPTVPSASSLGAIGFAWRLPRAANGHATTLMRLAPDERPAVSTEGAQRWHPASESPTPGP